MSQKTPVPIFTYNRPLHAQQMLDSLAACQRLEECQPIIFSDGPRIPEHEVVVRDVRQITRNWAKKYNAKLIERAKNLGLAHSIVDGVIKLCNEYGRVIVLEDDLVLHPAFVDFMLQSLDRYSDDDRIAQMAGFTFPIETSETPNTFLLPLTTSWGWATWKRAWDSFSCDIRTRAGRIRRRFPLACLL